MRFHLFTDGACQPNPGKGGWAFVVYPKDRSEEKIVQSGYQEDTTNNRMEMTAVLEGLVYLVTWHGCASKELRDPLEIRLFSDSRYLINGIEKWMHGWAKNKWIKKNHKPVLNNDLWKQIYSLSQNLNIECKYIKGHSGHPENEECDQLAVAEISKNK